MGRYLVVVGVLCVLLNSGCITAEPVDVPAVSLIPWPQALEISGGSLELTPAGRVVYTSKELSPLADLLCDELYQVTSMKLSATDTPAKAGDIVLTIDPSLDGQTHVFGVTDRVVIAANNYKNTAMASVSLLQAIQMKGDQAVVPKLSMTDTPHSRYRSLLVDVARQPHTIDTLKQCVVMCRLYKVNFLQLHLTDDQSFTFESKAFPQLASPGRHFTQAELKDLVAFADVRGVTLIPEFDAPGHTSSLRRAMPDLFGRVGLSVVNLGKEEVYDALFTIVNEMCDVFDSSPYFHIGADEAYFAELAKDEIALKAVKDKGYDSVHDLFLEFVVRMNDRIKANGKQTVMWESFQGKGSRKVTVPNDILIMAWETLYQLPQSLLDNDYTILNVSWKPTYITPGRRWNPDYIYGWNMFRWENHWKIAPSYNPIQLKPYPNDRIIGGMMCSWEGRDEMQVPAIRLRLAPLCERFWTPDGKLPYDHFAARFKQTDQVLQKLICPMAFQARGLTEPDYVGPFYNRENYFAAPMQLTLEPLVKDTTVRYTLDGSVPTNESALYSKPILIDQNTTVRTQVYDADGEKLGFIATRPYEFHPIRGAVEGLLMNVPHDDAGRGEERTQFGDQVTVRLSKKMANGTIHYTTDGSEPGQASPVYGKPIVMTQSGVVSARYFDADGRPQGSLWRRTFDRIDAETNLTTGKPVTASNSHPNGKPEYAVDGVVDRDFHWDGPGGAPQWWQVDLQDSHKLSKIQVVTYWDDQRYYKYTVEVSLDGKAWNPVVDYSQNTNVATKEGTMHTFDPIIARYIRVTMLHNSANPGLHLVEVRAYAD